MTPWLRNCASFYLQARLRKGAHSSMAVSSYLLYPIGVASETSSRSGSQTFQSRPLLTHLNITEDLRI